MGSNLSVPEKVAKLARSGDSANLQALLAELQRNDANFRANRARYLEMQDEQANTPLTLAAARGHLACVQLLLQFGSSVHHVNRKPDGGSALHEAVAHKHEAVVELLLRHGANPFVENSKGFTAMDIACSSRNVPLLRRLEQCAPYVGWLMMKVPQFGGLGSSWQRRWVVVSHRFPNPQAPAARQLTHCVFLAYKTLANTSPSCRVWLDGARAREVYHPKAEARLQYSPLGGPRVAQAGVTLHRKHELPSGVYTTGGHPGGGITPQEGYTFYLRPDDGSQLAVNALDKLIRVINNRGFPVGDAAPGPAPAAPPGGGGGAAAQRPQRPMAPPPQPGPLYASLMGQPPGAPSAGAGMPEMATAPGEWGSGAATPVGAVPPPAFEGTESDEQIARRLQEEYDAEVARQLQQQGGSPPGAPAAAVPLAAAGSGGGAAAPDYLTGGSFYPQIQFGDGATGLPPGLQQHGSGASHAAGSGSLPNTPAGAGAGGHQAFGARPSAPTLLDLDQPLAPLPLAAGAVGAAAIAAGRGAGVSAPPAPQHLPLSASGRHMSAPGMQVGAARPEPAVPLPARAASESSAPPPAVAGGSGAAGADSEDSAVCVFCMDAPATAGVLHGESVHKCLCRGCAIHLKDSAVQQCPMCREPVEAYIMRVF